MSNRNWAVSAICRASLLTASAIGLAHCGAATTPSGAATDGATLEVHVSAGGPVTGASVAVHALDNETTEALGIGDHGIIGSGGPTDETGKAVVTITVPGWTGPVQVVASGGSYPDPTVAWKDGKPGSVILIPGTFNLSSVLTEFRAGATGPVAVSLGTTLADHELLAYARGLHPLHPGKTSLSAAGADRDKLFVEHIAKSAGVWRPGSLRSTIAGALTLAPQPLTDSACAALWDVGLNWLARDMSRQAGLESAAMNAIALVELLAQDLDADAVFDGKGAAGAALRTDGRNPVSLDGQTLRLPFATALDEFVRAPDCNKSGLTRVDLANAGVYDAISGDTSDLFGGAPAGSFVLGRVPPSVAFATPIPTATSAALKVQVTATDNGAGVAAVYVQLNGAQAIRATASGTTGAYETAPLALAPGKNTIVAWAVDNAEVSGEGQPSPATATATVIFDNHGPDATYVTEFASYYDERGLTVATSGNLAVVPAQYVCSSAVHGCAKTSIQPDQGISKVATRLGWASQPTAAALEGPNPDNIPVLQWKVSYNPATDAPIAKATYSVAVSCAGCSYAAATGDLWPSATSSDTAVYFDLPVSSNLIPALTSLPGPATLDVTVAFTDAAGNAATSAASVPFHLLGPPLAVVPDDTYLAAGSPYRAHGSYLSSFTLSKGTYRSLWGQRDLSVWHYTVSNPHPQPVALNTPAGTWTTQETWKAHRRTGIQWFTQSASVAHAGACGIPVNEINLSSYCGQNNPCVPQWPTCADDTGCPYSACGCGTRILADVSYAGFLPSAGCGGPSWPHDGCVAAIGAPPGDWGTISGGTSPIYSKAYWGGQELTPKANDYVIPAATGSSPTAVDVELFVTSATRLPAQNPWAGAAGAAPPLPAQSCFGDGIGIATYYEYVTNQNVRKSCDGATVFETKRYYDYQYPDEIHDDITGSWSVTPKTLDAAFAEIGDPAPEEVLELNYRVPHN